MNDSRLDIGDGAIIRRMGVINEYAEINGARTNIYEKIETISPSSGFNVGLNIRTDLWVEITRKLIRR